jgi:hypothetical protein
MKRKIVLVKWVDSIHTGGWGDKPSSNTDCLTVGLLVERTKNHILVSMSASAYCDAHYIQIPAVSVKSVKTLKTVDCPE